MKRPQKNENSGARERILDAAYELFSRDGFHRVSIEAIVARAGCARASLYNSFGSKDGLIEAFLERREKMRTGILLEENVKQRSDDPQERLLAIFDVLDDWFQDAEYGHGTLIKMLLDADPDSYIHAALTSQLAKVRSVIHRLAEDALLEDPKEFSAVWHMLMKGAIIADREGSTDAAQVARKGGAILLYNWPVSTPAR